jgi:GntR family transcriptional regulator
MNQSCQPSSQRARRTDAGGRDLAYVRVMRRLETDIATGRLTPGERLAPERQLGARLDVARNTLRRALTDLAARGLLVSRDRSGWFVNASPVTIETISGPQGLTDWAAIHGLAVSSRVCQARIRPVLEAEARALRIPMDSNVYELERVRIVEGAPLSLDQSVLVPSLAESLAVVDFSSASLYQTLRAVNGTEPSRTECMLRAVVADRRSAELLELNEGSPLLDLSETVFDQYGEPFEFGRRLNRGDRYAFRTTIMAGGVWEGSAG